MSKEFYLIIVFLFLVSCSEEAGNKSVAPMSNENAETSIAFSFNTYRGLIAEEPCSESLRGSIAHVNESNLDYVCIFDDALTVWNWKVLQNSADGPISVQSSSSNNSTVFQYSSSSNYFLSSAVEPAYSSIVYPKSSSSGVSSSIMQVQSSSSKANWAYLNSAISYGEIEILLEKFKTVTIGSQTWMAENMYSLGSNCRSYKSEKLQLEGCLYGWEDAMKICPKGWHLPDSLEFAQLRSMVTSEALAYQFASRKWIYDYGIPNGDTTFFRGSDKYGFSAIPVGSTTEKVNAVRWNIDGDGEYTLFWTTSSTSNRTAGADAKNAFSIRTTLGFQSVSKSMGLAVRCLKDE